MSSDIEHWPPPNDATAFESVCLELWKEIWNDPSAQKNGRSGQPQAGVDIFSQRAGVDAGVQCKQKNGLLRHKLTSDELTAEAQAAIHFQPQLKSFILATSASRDGRLQEAARVLSQDYRQKGLFNVEVWSWQDIWPEIYKREFLLKRLAPQLWPQLAKSRTEKPTKLKRSVIAGSILFVLIASVVAMMCWPTSYSGPQLPQITIETLDGLPEKYSNDSRLRLNRLRIWNTNEVELLYFCSRLQFPEPIALTIEANISIGSTIGWRPLVDKLTISGTGGRTETGIWIGPTSSVHFVDSSPCFAYPGKHRGQKLALHNEGDITGIWELTIDHLPPGGRLVLDFLTSTGETARTYLEIPDLPFVLDPVVQIAAEHSNLLYYSLEGDFIVSDTTGKQKQTFILPLSYLEGQRKIVSSGLQPDIGNWNPVTLMLQ